MIIEMCPREKSFVLWGHCQNLLDDPRMYTTLGQAQEMTLTFNTHIP